MTSSRHLMTAMADEPALYEPEDVPYSGNQRIYSVVELIYQIRSRATFKYGEDITDRIDAIDAATIGRLNLGALKRFAPKCCEMGVRIAHEGLKWCIFTSSEDQLICLEKSGQPKEPIRQQVSEVVKKLHSDGLLEKAFWSERQVFCGAFLVEKKAAAEGQPTKYRFIADARIANSMFDASPFGFSLFSVETLITNIGSLSRFKAWHAVNLDLRHWFHQIPLHESLRNFFTFILFDKSRYRHKTVPMGWTLAPYIAQCCTWAMLLASQSEGKLSNLHNPEEFGISADVLEQILVSSTPPAWIPLIGGGMVAVILDNILVVTENAKFATNWHERIEAQLRRRFTAEIKAIEHVILTAENDKNFEFMGVKWAHHKRWIKVDPEEEAPGFKKGTWDGSHRDLSSMMGILLWHHRIHDSKMYTKELQEFRAIYQKVTPKDGRSWGTKMNLESNEVVVLLKHWRQRSLQGPEKACPSVNKLLTSYSPVFIVTDAELTRTAFAIYEPSSLNTIINCETELFSEKVIACNELRAIRNAIRFAVVTWPQSSVLVIVTDSMNAKAWVENQVGSGIVSNQYLCDIFRYAQDRQLHLDYIRTADNIADPLTRETGLDTQGGWWLRYMTRFEATRAKLLINRDQVRANVITDGASAPLGIDSSSAASAATTSVKPAVKHYCRQRETDNLQLSGDIPTPKSE